MTRLSVIIPGCGGGDLTARCLTHLAAHTTLELEVFYIDNGSGSGVVDEVRGTARSLGLPLTVVLNPANMGYTAAVNRGILAAGESDVLLLNNDCFTGPGCVDNLRAHHRENPRLAAIGPLTDDGGTQSIRRRWVRAAAGVPDEIARCAGDPVRCSALAQRRSVAFRGMITFFCALIPHSAVRNVGLLDWSFESGLGGDDEWCWRARQLGWKVAVAHDAFATHLHMSTFTRLGFDRQQLQREALEQLDGATGGDAG